MADKAIEVAIKLARDCSKGLYILAIRPPEAQTVQSSKPRASVQLNELAEFTELSSKFQIEVTGGHIVRPTESAMRSFIKSHHITHVVMASDQLVNTNTLGGHFLSAFAHSCPVPVSIAP